MVYCNLVALKKEGYNSVIEPSFVLHLSGYFDFIYFFIIYAAIFIYLNNTA